MWCKVTHHPSLSKVIRNSEDCFPTSFDCTHFKKKLIACGVMIPTVAVSTVKSLNMMPVVGCVCVRLYWMHASLCLHFVTQCTRPRPLYYELRRWERDMGLVHINPCEPIQPSATYTARRSSHHTFALTARQVQTKGMEVCSVGSVLQELQQPKITRYRQSRAFFNEILLYLVAAKLSLEVVPFCQRQGNSGDLSGTMDLRVFVFFLRSGWV